jgi:hypothetical protein
MKKWVPFFEDWSALSQSSIHQPPSSDGEDSVSDLEWRTRWKVLLLRDMETRDSSKTLFFLFL